MGERCFVVIVAEVSQLQLTSQQ